MATPRLTQKLGSRLDGSRISITKLVECPVVDKTPRRSLVLYRGQLRRWHTTASEGLLAARNC